MTTTIVVGVNGSERSLGAVEWAVDRAGERGCPLELVTVVEFTWVGPGYMDERPLRDAANAFLEEARSHALARSPGLTVATRLVTGDPVARLSEAVPDGGLLVLGAHHLSRLGGAILAPVSVRVAAAAHSAVALIPAGSGAERRGVVVGVDGSPASLEAIQFAAEEADRSGETLTAVHAWQLPGTWADSVPVEKTIIDAIQEDERLLLSESLAGLAERFPDLTIERRLERGTVVEVLATLAADARLLVVGSHGRKAFMRLLLGSVSHSMALSMPSPVVVVRQRADT